MLQQVVAGSAIVALAAAEPDSGDDLRRVTTTAARDGDDWVLSGSKIMALAAPLATHLLITARTSGNPADTDGISLFLVDLDRAPAGLHMHGYRTIDDRRAADLVLDGLRLPRRRPARRRRPAWPSLEQARDEGAAAVAAEAVGAMRKVLADTVAYCKQRQQFGQPIGSFQALQHRMVDMYLELEQAAASLYLVILNLDDADPWCRAFGVSAAKATIGRAARFIGQNAVQLHGGMGMTEELAIGHYFKRLTALQYEFGSTDYHLARFAELTRPGAHPR
ncbi:Caffeyl-CoA reductase-Etf complex subunit CarC [Mycobacterium talmoniae]|uniref:Caffeyl-CoA reductase-Etf complex subunit CarC n=1 Tax=Mycobacterium talmoniae TaxID=1858794 RepID=A0A2S8BGM5_9MYCO|nr:Caffeyl-CoA reductase-Etf complex subunit CarC [Mycobacterium talmoniae]